MSGRLHAALEAKRLLEVIRTPRGPDPRALHDLEGAELEGLRETAVGRAFGVLRAELSADGRFCRIHVADASARAPAVPEDLCDSPAPRIGQTQGHGPSSDPGRETTPPTSSEPAELTPDERMAAIRSEPHWEVRAAMLALEVGHRNAQGAR